MRYSLYAKKDYNKLNIENGETLEFVDIKQSKYNKDKLLIIYYPSKRNSEDGGVYEKEKLTSLNITRKKLFEIFDVWFNGTKPINYEFEVV
jgi:hypothetical protein